MRVTQDHHASKGGRQKQAENALDEKVRTDDDEEAGGRPPTAVSGGAGGPSSSEADGGGGNETLDAMEPLWQRACGRRAGRACGAGAAAQAAGGGDRAEEKQMDHLCCERPVTCRAWTVRACTGATDKVRSHFGSSLGGGSGKFCL